MSIKASDVIPLYFMIPQRISNKESLEVNLNATDPLPQLPNLNSGENNVFMISFPEYLKMMQM